LFSCNL